MQTNELTSYLSDGIFRLITSVLKESAADGAEKRFLVRQIRVQKHRSQRRKRHERAGLHVPAFLIASITERCNLHCKGCYARSCGFCSDTPEKTPLSADDWKRIFSEADALGISFVLLAGGEPLLNREVISAAAKEKNLIFPVFTNGTQFDTGMTELFIKSRNLFPVFSIEGGSASTDARRGEGVFAKASSAAETFRQNGVLFGAAVTVSKENIREVTSDVFFEGLSRAGTAAVFLIEYTASGESDRALEPDADDRRFMAERLASARKRFRSLWFLSFPGDEELMGGCLAAGRGFFHINPFGAAEPCPFAPLSDRNLKDCSLKEAIESPLFSRLSAAELTRIPHDGGCALAGRTDEIREMTNDSR
ncbi:MAG: radical SAM protein [Methanocorpusculum sp.]|nr:radical SAM protein [Methanocorpusculum sp.]